MGEDWRRRGGVESKRRGRRCKERKRKVKEMEERWIGKGIEGRKERKKGDGRLVQEESSRKRRGEKREGEGGREVETVGS